MNNIQVEEATRSASANKVILDTAPPEGSKALKTALITGITGQDGSHLADLLLAKKYEVHGIIRRASTFNTQRIDHLYRDPHDPDVHMHLHYGDLTDGSQIARAIRTVQPDEIYNLGAQSHVAVSFQQPEYTGDADALGVIRLLEAIRDAEIDVRLYQAGTSEMFGDSPPPQSESSEFRPRSPYAAAKAYAHWMVSNYREAYGIYAVNGIMFNHEGERRGETFVTRKITRAVASIVTGTQSHVYLGNLDASRDWGYAKDYVRAMWMMLQPDEPEDYVIGTGSSHTVREFCEMAFGLVGLNSAPFVKIDPVYLRPTEVEHLRADATRANKALGWKPETSFEELVTLMVRHDLKEVDLDLALARLMAADRHPSAVRDA